MRHRFVLILGLLSALGAYHAMAQTTDDQGPDLDAGKSRFHPCAGCHAIPGYANAYPTYHVPRLAGQKASYVVDALTAYQNGQRQHPSMQANSADLSPEDMANIGAYLESLGGEAAEKSPRIRGNVSAGQRKSAVCQSCHGADGVGITPQWPNLAGQYEDYLRRSLHAYKSGARQNAIMNGFASGLSDQDIADLAAYYASRDRVLSTVDY